MSEPKLKDVVSFGTREEQQAAITRLCRAYDDLRSWSEQHSQRTPIVVALRKFLVAASQTGILARCHFDGVTPIEVLALAARNMFELGLRVRHVMLKPENLKLWSAETVAGRIDLYEGLLSGVDHKDERAKLILAEIEIQRQWAAERGVSVLPKKSMLTRNLAKAVQADDEYVVFYRMYSKLVHPSGYSVNYPREDVDSWVHRDVMLIKLQQYGLDLLERVRVALGAPEEILCPEGAPPNQPLQPTGEKRGG